MIILRSTCEGAPYYYGPGIDLITAIDIRMRRWENGNWAPDYNSYATINTPMAWGDRVHFKVTVQGETVQVKLTKADNLVIEDEVGVGPFKEAGFIWLRSTSTSDDNTKIENVIIKQLD